MITHKSIGLDPKYQAYARQKCFIAYSEQANWSVDLLSTCEEVLNQSECDLEVDYARKHFAADIPLRQKALELIANARYGLYDISYWRNDQRSPWQMPRNVMIELGIAIALNRPILLLRHDSNQELPLPTSLQGLHDRILKFSGTKTLKKKLSKNVSKWIDQSPEAAWWNRYCCFGGRVCSYREAHPRAKQFGEKELNCIVVDSQDSSRPDFRSVVEDVLERFGDVTYTYLDSLSLTEGYNFLLCSHCQMVRSAPFSIYRINTNTPPEAFISIGISLALETQFEYKIPKILIAEDLRDIPSLLAGYEVFIALNDKDRKNCLKRFMPTVLKDIRHSAWKPRPLPFIEITINIQEESDPDSVTSIHEQSEDINIEYLVYAENFSKSVTSEDIKEVWEEYGNVLKVYLPNNPNTNQILSLALIEMSSVTAADASVEALDGAEWLGREIKVRKAKFDDLIYRGSQNDLDNSDAELSDTSNNEGNSSEKPQSNLNSQDKESATSLYIGNLDYSISREDIREVFADYGTVKRVHLPLDRETKRPRGFAFVEMSANEEVDAAVEALDGAEWIGREIRVNIAKPRSNR